MSEKEKRKRVLREVAVKCYQAHADNVWTNVGQATTVQQCQALRPPHHVTGYVRLDPNTSKGVTQTLTNNFIFVVLEGEVSVEMAREVLGKQRVQAAQGIAANNVWGLEQ